MSCVSFGHIRDDTYNLSFWIFYLFCIFLIFHIGDHVAGESIQHQKVDNNKVIKAACCTFYPHGANCVRVLAVIMCLCVCLSHPGIVSKWLNVGSRKQLHVIAQGL